MDICDFMYRGEMLSEHGYEICNFGDSGSPSVSTTDSQRTYNNFSMLGGKYFPITSYKYEDTLEYEIPICKKDTSSPYISPRESADMKRWLCVNKPCELRMGGEEYENIFWVGVFNIEEVRWSDDRVGFNLKFKSIAPFGFKDIETMSYDVDENGIVLIGSISDEEGFLYPDVSIEIFSDGDLKITNSVDERTTVINNCKSGEIITMSHLLQISSNDSSHDLGRDFNYKFIRIYSSYEDSMNTLSVNLKCKFSISYNPIAKVVMA